MSKAEALRWIERVHADKGAAWARAEFERALREVTGPLTKGALKEILSRKFGIEVA